MTRLFRDGRTETVRSCSIESSQWVKSMDDATISVRKQNLKFLDKKKNIFIYIEK